MNWAIQKKVEVSLRLQFLSNKAILNIQTYNYLVGDYRSEANFIFLDSFHIVDGLMLGLEFYYIFSFC